MSPQSTLRWTARDSAATLVARLDELVSAESPSGSLPHLTACADLLASWGETVLGRPVQRIVEDGRPHLLWPAQNQRVLLLGHFDTVWPAGTIDGWPFTVNGETATGPGVYDMKAGIIQLFAALDLMEDTSSIGLLLTSDEETGSETSRPLIEEQARRSGAVLVLEPATTAGELKVARKGASLYRLNIGGRAAHAGAEPHLGVNATVELAHQVIALQDFASTVDGTSVTPTALNGGTTCNTVPAEATVCIDVRAWTGAELDRVDQAIRALPPRLPEATLTVDGGINRYPMPSDTARALLHEAQTAAKDIGLPPPDGAHVAGGSDGNFTAALGVPTLDGLGAIGGHAHGRGEYVDITAMPERAALLAVLLERLLARQPMAKLPFAKQSVAKQSAARQSRFARTAKFVNRRRGVAG